MIDKKDYRYVEIIKGGKYNRGNVVLLPDGTDNYTLDYFGKEVVEGYHSVYMHHFNFQDYKDADGKRKGYDGNVYSNTLVFDFDSGDLQVSQQLTVELCQRMMAYSTSNIRLYFSGSKGFHLIYISPELSRIETDTHELLVKNSCLELAKGLKIDPAIYDRTRIFRTPNSKHGSSGLYKIPITYEELTSLSSKDIQELANKQRQLTYNEPLKFDEDLFNLINGCKEQKQQPKTSGTDLLDGVLYGFGSGNRNNGLASLAGLLHSRGLSNDITTGIVNAVNKLGDTPLPEMEINTICNSISRYNTNPEYVKPICSEILTIEDAANEWYEIRKKTEYTYFGERLGHLNERLRGVLPGDVIGIVGSSGTGKTAFGLDVANCEAREQNMYGMFASLEMSRAGLFFRIATMESPELANDENRVPNSEVTQRLMEEQSSLKQKILKEWKHLRFIDKGGMSLEQIVDYYKRANDILEGKLSNLVIDYTQNLKGYEDVKESMAISRGLKEVAKELKTKVFPLMQTNKNYFDEYSKVMKKDIEGVGAVFQACDYILTLYKSRDNPNRLHSEFLKDRWNGAGYIYDIIKTGLKYHTENYSPDRDTGGL